ncbi:MAG: hypothetical protein P8J50_11035 [Acidimicrobiales bacterium]|nr:hypothetical protein [Acidimicrobiales bacterium]
MGLTERDAERLAVAPIDRALTGLAVAGVAVRARQNFSGHSLWLEKHPSRSM